MAKYWRVLSLAAVVLVLACGMAMANPDPAVDFDSVNYDFTNGTWSLGWEFNVLSPVTVTTLGFYDDLMNGLTENHDVGIWDPSGSLLVSGTVTPGSPLVGWFRWTAVPLTTLAVGDGYRIAATTGSENYTWEPNGLTVVPQIELVQSRETSSSTLVYPENTDVQYGIFGPNFNIVKPVPEPASVAALGLMASGLLAPLYRRLRKG